MLSSLRSPSAKLLSILLLAPLPLASAQGDPPAFEDDFESGSPGWTATGLWAPSSRASASPTTAWHYAVELADGTSTYDTGAANAGELVSPPIDLAGMARAKASFWARWEGEATCSYEHPELFVQRADGTRALAWEACTAEGEGGYEANLSAFVGQTIRLVFRWDTRDAFDNAHDGLYVDDVAVSEGDPAPVQPTVDLAVRAISTNGTFVAGTNASLLAVIEDRGLAGTTTPFTVVFRIDGVDVGARRFASISGGGALVATVATRMPAQGEHLLEVEVDVHDNVTEANEANNARTVVLQVAAPRLDLQVRALNVTGPLYAGYEGTATAVLRLDNDTTRDAIVVEWTLDGAQLARKVVAAGFPPGDIGLSLALPPLTLGEHQLELRVDADDTAMERNETNNVISRSFEVFTIPEVSLAIVEFGPVRVRTELGDAPHPLGRHEVTLRACNASPSASARSNVSLLVRADVGNASLPTRNVTALAGGACLDDTFQFDTPGVVGDFTFHATLTTPYDGNASDNAASARGFRVAADLGGAAVPGGAMHQPEPPPPPALVAQAIGAAEATLAALTDDPAGGAIDLAQEAACPGTPCDLGAGDPGFGAFRPCRGDPNASANLLPWLVWYGVQVSERGGTFEPQSVPLNGLWTAAGVPRWPVPSVDAGRPEGAPHVCEDQWAALREATS